MYESEFLRLVDEGKQPPANVTVEADLPKNPNEYRKGLSGRTLSLLTHEQIVASHRKSAGVDEHVESHDPRTQQEIACAHRNTIIHEDYPVTEEWLQGDIEDELNSIDRVMPANHGPRSEEQRRREEVDKVFAHMMAPALGPPLDEELDLGPNMQRMHGAVKSEELPMPSYLEAQVAYDRAHKHVPRFEPIAPPPNYGNRDSDLPKSAEEAAKQMQQKRWSAFEILTRAAEIVTGARLKTHGPKERNHQNIADLWTAYLGGRLKGHFTAKDVALMQALLKIARMNPLNEENPDDYVDGAGYIANAGEIALNGKEII